MHSIQCHKHAHYTITHTRIHTHMRAHSYMGLRMYTVWKTNVRESTAMSDRCGKGDWKGCKKGIRFYFVFGISCHFHTFHLNFQLKRGIWCCLLLKFIRINLIIGIWFWSNHLLWFSYDEDNETTWIADCFDFFLLLCIQNGYLLQCFDSKQFWIYYIL